MSLAVQQVELCWVFTNNRTCNKIEIAAVEQLKHLWKAELLCIELNLDFLSSFRRCKVHTLEKSKNFGRDAENSPKSIENKRDIHVIIFARSKRWLIINTFQFSQIARTWRDIHLAWRLEPLMCSAWLVSKNVLNFFRRFY